jgi:hypothetical protein
MKLTSDFALLSVKDGREELAAHFEDRPRLGPCPGHLRIPVTIVGYIDAPWGADDGIDQEFSVIVEHLSTAKPKVEFTTHVSLGLCVNPTYDNLPEALERARHERTIRSYVRDGAKRSSSVSRTITVGEVLYASSSSLPSPEAEPA